MKWIGLTGGIGTGKSTVSQLLRAHGLPVIDADEVARFVVEPGQTGLLELRRVFGPAILNGDGTLNRPALGKRVFQNEEDRNQVERVLHPLIRLETEKRKKACEEKGDAIAVYDVPLLFEKNMEDLFDLTAVVTSHPDQQISRVQKRDQLTKTEVQARMASQLPISEKARRADYVIANTSSLFDLATEVQKFYEVLKAL